MENTSPKNGRHAKTDKQDFHFLSDLPNFPRIARKSPITTTNAPTTCHVASGCPRIMTSQIVDTSG